MLSKVLEMGNCFHRSPVLGEHGGPLREGKKKFLYLGKFFNKKFERYVKKTPLTGSSLHRGPVGKLGGGSFTGTFERKEKCISGFLFLDPGDIES